MEDIARFHQIGQQRVLLGSGVDGRKQLEQGGFVVGTRVFLECLAQRELFHPSGLGEAGGIGGHEGKGELRVALVFGEVQGNASNARPQRRV